MQNILNILQGWLVDASPGTALDSRSCQTIGRCFFVAWPTKCSTVLKSQTRLWVQRKRKYMVCVKNNTRSVAALCPTRHATKSIPFKNRLSPLTIFGAASDFEVLRCNTATPKVVFFSTRCAGFVVRSLFPFHASALWNLFTIGVTQLSLFRGTAQSNTVFQKELPNRYIAALEPSRNVNARKASGVKRQNFMEIFRQSLWVHLSESLSYVKQSVNT